MKPKSLAFLSFLQTMVITISLISINMGLYQTMQIYYYNVDHKRVGEAPIQLPLKVLFYQSLTEYVFYLYLIPLIWFILSVIYIHRSGSSRMAGLVTFWSAIFISIFFIFLTVDATYLVIAMDDSLYYYWHRLRENNHWNLQLWAYIAQWVNYWRC